MDTWDKYKGFRKSRPGQLEFRKCVLVFWNRSAVTNCVKMFYPSKFQFQSQTNTYIYGHWRREASKALGLQTSVDFSIFIQPNPTFYFLMPMSPQQELWVQQRPRSGDGSTSLTHPSVSHRLRPNRTVLNGLFATLSVFLIERAGQWEWAANSLRVLQIQEQQQSPPCFLPHK